MVRNQNRLNDTGGFLLRFLGCFRLGGDGSLGMVMQGGQTLGRLFVGQLGDRGRVEQMLMLTYRLLSRGERTWLFFG